MYEYCIPCFYKKYALSQNKASHFLTFDPIHFEQPKLLIVWYTGWLRYCYYCGFNNIIGNFDYSYLIALKQAYLFYVSIIYNQNISSDPFYLFTLNYEFIWSHAEYD